MGDPCYQVLTIDIRDVLHHSVAVAVQHAEYGQTVQEDSDPDGDEQDAEQSGEHLEHALVHTSQQGREHPCEDQVHHRDQCERPATVHRPPQPPDEIDSSRSAAIAIGLTTNGSSIARNPLDSG